MSKLSQTTILIVDDDEMVRDSLRALLESRNFTVTDFATGQDFLARRDATNGSCVLLDIHMPGMTGVDLLKTLRERGDLIPVILITGRTDAGIQAQAKAFGAAALLDKPIAAARLFAAIADATAAVNC